MEQQSFPPGTRVRAFQGPNEGKWGTVLPQGTTPNTHRRIKWDRTKRKAQ